MANPPVIAESNVPTVAAVQGTHTKSGGVGLLGVAKSNGVHGKSTGDGLGSAGVFGEAIDGPGVSGSSISSVGMDAKSVSGPAALRAIHEGTGGPGVLGVSKANGVHGKSTGDGLGSAGVFGEAIDGPGVSGSSISSVGMDARSENGPAALRAVGVGRTNGVIGHGTGTGTGVVAISENGIGISGKGGKLAGQFEGDVLIHGHLHCDDVHCPNGDCAEDFDIAHPNRAEPGTVMVVGAEGTLYESVLAYDKRVAGVVSGAGRFKPALVLDRQPGTSANRKSIALLGKTYCKADASHAPIEVGDLLTTSQTPGHAMKAADPLRAFGAVLGKALLPLATGRGLIPILIALQ